MKHPHPPPACPPGHPTSRVASQRTTQPSRRESLPTSRRAGGSCWRGVSHGKSQKSQKRDREYQRQLSPAGIAASVVVVVTSKTDVVDIGDHRAPRCLSGRRERPTVLARKLTSALYQLDRLFRRRWIPFTWLGPPRFREKRGRDLLVLAKLFERLSRMRTDEE